MENNKATRGETLENIVIGDGTTTPQYMIQRIPENSQLLSSELLQNHNGLVVDLGGTDFIPVSYSSEDLLSQDLTEEDRNLAAALVAVQLSQQQKQQQIQDAGTLPALVANTNLGAKILEDQPLIISGEKGGTSLFRIVNSDNLYVEQQTLPKLVDAVKFSAAPVVHTQVAQQTQQSQQHQQVSNVVVAEPATTITAVSITEEVDLDDNTPIKKEVEEKGDSDRESLRNEQRTSKKSLPHKKRISRKLKKNSATANRKIVCNLCEQTFASSDEFAQHEMLCQTTITPVNPVNSFNCQICTEPFTDQLKFFEHLKKHYEPGGGGLPTGPPQSTTKPVAIQPVTVQKREPSPEKPQIQEVPTTATPAPPPAPEPTERQESLLTSLLNLTCIQCNKTYRRQKTFEAHMRDIHSSKEEQMDEFSDPEDLMEGINVVVDGNEGNDDEEDDSKAWYREEDLHQTEEDLKELEAGNEHVCHLCNQPFPLRAILLQHLVTCRATNGSTTESVPLAVVKKINKKKQKKATHECTECDRKFTHRNSLVYHMRSHTGIRPHQCDQCGKSFFASSALKVHMRLHSGDKPYSCEHCGKRFRQWGDLKYHITSLHSTEKNFQCEYCGKEFARKYSLVVHRRIHTGERNYKCEYCGKTFRASSYLQNHRKIHTGEKPHMCGVCGKPFRVKSDMKRHQNIHAKTPGVKQTRTLAAKVEKHEVIMEEEELSTELHIEDDEAAGHLLTEYTPEQLEAATERTTTTTTVRVPNRNLYLNGHELFLVTYPSDLRPGDPQTSTATWVHTTTA